MTKSFGWITGALVGAMVAAPSVADVRVEADIDKQKTIRVTEDKVLNAVVGIFVLGEFLELDGAAEAEAIVNAFNVRNVAFHFPGTDGSAEGKNIREVLLGEDGGTLSDNQGILGINIDVGNMTNQANVVSIAVTGSSSSVTDAQAAADQQNKLNYAANFGPVPPLPAGAEVEPGTTTARVGVERTLAVSDSMNDNGGVVLLNLNAGDMNNQANTVALAVGSGGYVALSEADLGQVNVDSVILEDRTVAQARIVDSMNRGEGIVGINQSAGNLNNQASAVSIAATASSVSVPALSFGQ